MKSNVIPFDLDRTKLRLDGLGHYASVSTLVLSAALTLSNATPKKLDERKSENAIKLAFVSCIITTVVLGAYTSMVFSLLSLYSKTFLGMMLDEEFVEFFQATAEIRRSAFASFVGAMLSFNAAFVISLCLHYEGRVRFWIATITSVVLAICAQSLILIINSASHMFQDS